MIGSHHPSARFPGRRGRAWGAAAGFTLVELMVAVTGGLFVSIIVFSISKNSARFYQSETRVGEATLGGIVGFERLRADIARAGYLASPNIRMDREVCAGPADVAGFPELLDSMTSIRVLQDETTALNNPNLEHDSILLAGSYSSIDFFAIRSFEPVDTGYRVTLVPTSGGMTRLGYDPNPSSTQDRDALLEGVFLPGRAVRILDTNYKQYYGIVAGVNTQSPNDPAILLAPTPVIVRQGDGGLCGIPGDGSGSIINVVNFIRYDIARMAGETGYAPLYADGGAAPFDDTRTELRRSELDPSSDSGEILAGTTPELVAQYAVNLEFGLIFDNRASVTAEPNLTALAPDDSAIDSFSNWHRVRAVRVRLGVRTREADREVDIDPGAQGLPLGMYRIGLGPAGAGPFARVRTLQSDVMLNNTTIIKER